MKPPTPNSVMSAAERLETNMNNSDILASFEAFGETLRQMGDQVCINYWPRDQRFSIGVAPEGDGLGPSIFGHDASPAKALVKALALRSDHADELAFKERCRIKAEELVRAEMAAEHRQAA